MNFNQFNLDSRLLVGINNAGYDEATPIQEVAIPAALAAAVTQSKRDVMYLDYVSNLTPSVATGSVGIQPTIGQLVKGVSFGVRATVTAGL